MKDKLKRFARNKKASIPTALALVLILVALNARGGDESEFETRKAARTDVSQVVSVTGSVKSASAVELAFERGGKLASLPVKTGDRVERGQTLAAISNSDLNAELQSRLSALDRERIKLSELTGRAGADGRSSANVRNAETSISNARFALADKLNDAFVRLDDAVRNHADKLFENPESSPSFGVDVSSGGTTYRIAARDIDTRLSINSQRRNLEEILDEWAALPQGSATSIESDASASEKALLAGQKLLSDIALVINSLEADDASAKAVYGEYKTDISSARTNVNAALSALRTAMQAYESAKTGLEVARRPGSSDEIAIQESNVRSAQAQVDAVRADIAKTVIVAPVAGVITKADAEVGEIVPANTPVISLIAESDLEIEVNVPEADIAKVRPGAEADVTFDAYGKDFVISAKVLSVDPAETLIDGVPTYRTILGFETADERIKSGLTANVDIRGEKRTDVVAVPQRAVVTKEGERIVRVVVDGKPVERKVKIGLRGSEGLVEIVDGIAEGEEVVVTPEEK